MFSKDSKMSLLQALLHLHEQNNNYGSVSSPYPYRNYATYRFTLVPYYAPYRTVCILVLLYMYVDSTLILRIWPQRTTEVLLIRYVNF